MSPPPRRSGKYDPLHPASPALVLQAASYRVELRARGADVVY